MNPPVSTRSIHHSFMRSEQFVRALWIFGVLWFFFWLLLFWFRPVGMFRSNITSNGLSNEVVRIMPWQQPREHIRPGEPTVWDKLLLEQVFPVFVLYLILSIPAWLASVLARSRSWWAGGSIGVVLGYLGGWLFVDGMVGVGGAIVVGLLGALFDYLVSRHYKIRLLGGHMPSWWAGGRWGGRGNSRWRWGSA